MKGQKLSPKGKQLRSAVILQELRNLQGLLSLLQTHVNRPPHQIMVSIPLNVSEKTEKGRDEGRRGGGRKLLSPLVLKDSLPG